MEFYVWSMTKKNFISRYWLFSVLVYVDIDCYRVNICSQRVTNEISNLFSIAICEAIK